MNYLKSNERSEAIELIKESQSLFENNDFVFQEATGEQSLGKNGNDDQRANTLFPDILYYTDKRQNQVALGWELKMPDTDIDDTELYNNAVDKADRLSTNVFVLWNFKQVKVYYRKSEGGWIKSGSWNDLSDNKTRDDVVRNRKQWKDLLKKVIVHLNTLFREDIVSTVPVLKSAESISKDIAEIYSQELADYYRDLGDRRLIAEIKRWYDTELMEFYSIDSKKVSDEEKIKVYSKNTLLNWINRVTFANLLKNNHNSVYDALRVLLEDDKTFFDIQNAFNDATRSSDFYTILNCQDTDVRLSPTSQKVIRQFAAFLFKKDFADIKQEEFQNTLESIIDLSKRELMGLYTTPKNLATLLVNSTVENINSNILDPCVGSGTIASSALKLLSRNGNLNKAHDNVWSSDKYRLPLQVANISLSSIESLNLPNQVFQKDLLSLKTGEVIKITNPMDGGVIEKPLPEFDYIISNLPFIRSERLKQDEEERSHLLEVNKYLHDRGIQKIDLKSDWYYFGIVGIERLLKDKGTAAVIVSNSWLKTKKRDNYINILFQLFEVQKVIISSNGRWFDNADVVTVILVLKKKSGITNQKTKFIKMNTNVKLISEKEIDNISDSILLSDASDENIEIIDYTKDEIQKYISFGLSLNILFHNINWFESILKVTVPMNEIFDGERGTKSTNDRFFYDIASSENIEQEYLVPVLKKPSSINGFFASADSEAFVVTEDKNQLKIGAQNYIEKFDDLPKNASQQALKVWYQFPKKVTGDFVTSLNPDQRLFWSSVPSDLLINQRLTVFRLKNRKFNKELIHALLNTFFAQFMIEATGFGRGLGVLDTTKEGILDSIILNPELLSVESEKEIIGSWSKLSIKEVPNILDQLYSDDWIEFNKLVLDKFGKVELLNKIRYSIENSVKMRSSVRK